MNKKTLKFGVLMLMMVFILAACGGQDKPANTETETTTNTTATTTDSESTESTGDKILRTNNSSEPNTLDPALAKGTHESWVLQHIFEGLMKYDENGELVPAMAESYEVSEDGLTYTFKIRDDVKWSNGDPLTAKDFEYAWKRVIDPELASEYSFQITDYVEGAEEYLNGEGTIEDVKISATDDKTLEVTLKKPAPYFLGLTAFYTLYPVNQGVVEENADWANDPSNTEYVSNGAFTLTGWDHNEKITLRKNPNYYEADQVKLDGIDLDIIEEKNTSYSKYQGGEYDFLMSPPPAVVEQFTKENNEELHIGDDVGTYYYEFNTTEKPFNNEKVRNALSQAIDRKVIVENITKGGQVPAEGMVPFGFLDENNEEFRTRNGNLITEDATAAKALLEEGLKEEGMTLNDIQGTTVLFNTDEAHRNIAQAIQQMWKQNLGLDVNLENAEFKVVLDRRDNGDFTIARAGWVGDYLDPNTMLDIFMSNNPQNDSKYENAAFDALIKEAGQTNDQKVRFEKMAEAEKILMTEKPIIPIYFYTQPYLQKPYLTGVYKNALNYPYFTHADLDVTQR